MSEEPLLWMGGTRRLCEEIDWKFWLLEEGELEYLQPRRVIIAFGYPATPIWPEYT